VQACLRAAGLIRSDTNQKYDLSGPSSARVAPTAFLHLRAHSAAFAHAAPHPPSTQQQILLAALAALYAVAFTSLLVQTPSLIGSDGVAPALSHLRLTAEQLIDSADYASAPWRLFAAAPSLLWFHSSLGLSIDSAQLALGLSGLALALSVLWVLSGSSSVMEPGTPALAAAMGGLWLLLLSVRNVGQGFLSGAW